MSTSRIRQAVHRIRSKGFMMMSMGRMAVVLTCAFLLVLLFWPASSGGQSDSQDQKEEKKADSSERAESDQEKSKDSQAEEGAEESVDQLFERLGDYVEALKENPEGPEAEGLLKKMNEVLEKSEDQLEKDPRAKLNVLPERQSKGENGVQPPSRGASAAERRAQAMRQRIQMRGQRPETPRRKGSVPTGRSVGKGVPATAEFQGRLEVEQVGPEERISLREKDPNLQHEEFQADEAGDDIQMRQMQEKLERLLKEESNDSSEQADDILSLEEEPSSEEERQAEASPSPVLDERDQEQEELTGDDIKIKTTDDVIELNKLLEAIGKELKLNFIYPDGEIPTGRVKLQQYGQIHRQELLPLLKSVLAFTGYSMVREGEFVRVVKRDDVLKKTDAFYPFADQPEAAPDESVVVRMIELQNASFREVQQVLEKFVLDGSVLTDIPNTNYMILTDYAYRMPRLLEIISMVDQPGPERKLEVLQPRYINASDAQGQIEKILGMLKDSDVSGGDTLGRRARPRSRRPPRPSRQPAAPEQKAEGSPDPSGSQAEDDKPSFLVDVRSNRLLVVATEEQIEQVKHLLSLFDVALPEAEIELQVIEVEYLQVEDAVKTLQELMEALSANDQEEIQPGQRAAAAPAPAKAPPRKEAKDPESTIASTGTGGKGPYMLADVRTSSVFIVGTKKQISQARDLLNLLDQAVPGADVRVEAIGLNYLLAETAGEQVSELLKAIREQQGDEPEQKSAPNQRSARRPQPARLRTPNQPPAGSDAKSDGQSGFMKAGEEGPFFLADIRTNRLLVVGNDDQIKQVHELLALLDINIHLQLKPIRIEHVSIVDVASQIADLLVVLMEQDQAQIGDQGVGPQAIGGTSGAGQSPSPQPPSPQRRRPGTSSRISTGGNLARLIAIVPKGPYLLPIERTSQLLVIGNEDQIQKVESLLGLLDVEIQLKLEPIQIQHVLASDIAVQLANLMGVMHEQEDAANLQGTGTSDRAGGMTSSRGRAGRTTGRQDRFSSITQLVQVQPRNLYLLADDRTNRLLVIGTDRMIPEIKDLLPLLDVPPSGYDKMQLYIHQGQFVEATEIVKILEDLGITGSDEEGMRPRDRARNYQQEQRRGLGEQPQTGLGPSEEGTLLPGMMEPEIRVAVQESSNRILIYATEYQIRDIKKIIEYIDREPDDLRGKIRIYFLENREPSVVADMLKQLLESDTYTSNGQEGQTRIPGREGAPIIVPLDEIYAVSVRASSKQHDEIERIINILDKRQPQVLVEAILIQVNESDDFKLGISLKDSVKVSSNHISGLSPFSFAAELAEGSLVATGSGATVAFFDDDLVYATLEALHEQGNGKVVSMPRILVNDNESGTITNQRGEPTTEIVGYAGSENVSESFKGYEEAGTTLTITPHISDGDFLQLEIEMSVDSFDGKSVDGIPPPKNSNNINTLITVPDNMTIVLGGLSTQNNATGVSKVPILGDLPLIGAAFRKVTRSDQKGSLYVFVKAQIARSQEGEDNRPDFYKDLGKMSEEYYDDYQKRIQGFRQQPIIPGMEEKREDDSSILDMSAYEKRRKAMQIQK